MNHFVSNYEEKEFQLKISADVNDIISDISNEEDNLTSKDEFERN